MLVVSCVFLRQNKHIPLDLQINSMNFFYMDTQRKINVEVVFSDPWVYEFVVIGIYNAVSSDVPWGGYTDHKVRITYDYLNEQEESFFAQFEAMVPLVYRYTVSLDLYPSILM